MKRNRFESLAYVASLGVHLLFLIFFASVKIIPASYVTEEGVEVEWVELEDSDASLEKRQIVEQDEKPANTNTPLQDYKLSKNDQRILDETKAQNNGAFKNSAEQNAGEESQQAQEQAQTPQEPEKTLSLADLKPNMIVRPRTPRPSKSGSGAGADASATDDYLKDVKTGAQTLLNTREFIYYSYYNRIKGKLRQYWEPIIKAKITYLLKRGRRIAATSDKITRLVITLDQTGKLTRVQVRGASGYRELDEAAIEAFRAAAPFPNPPKGISDSKGEIKINWDFVLES